MFHHIVVENISPLMLHEIKSAFRDQYVISLLGINVKIAGFTPTKDEHGVLKCVVKYTHA